MVGLPGRGKSFISRRVARYLRWKGVPCGVFNAGDYRRQEAGAKATGGSEFFDPKDEKAVRLREKWAEMATNDLMDFLEENQQKDIPASVGILDATNTTVARRQWVVNSILQRNPKWRVLFVESICNDQSMIRENILRSKCGGADFEGVHDANQIVQDFEVRIKHYEEVYEPLSEAEGHAFIKITNVKQNVVIHKVVGAIQTRLTYFLLNLHPVAYPVYLTLPGEAVWERKGTFGGDDDSLTSAGKAYAQRLGRFVWDRISGDVPLTILFADTPGQPTHACRETVRIIQEYLTYRINAELGADGAGGQSSPRKSGGSSRGTSMHRDPTRDPMMVTTRETSTPPVAGDSGRSDSSGYGDVSAKTVAEAIKKQKIRFCPMQSLEGIKYGNFHGKTPARAQERFPKTFAKLFGEQQAQLAAISRNGPGSSIMNFGGGNSPTVGQRNSTPIPIGGVSARSQEGSFEEGTPSLIVTAAPNSHAGQVGGSPFQEPPRLANSGSGPLPARRYLFRPHYNMTFPRGESCRQVSVRLERVLLEIMRLDGPVMVIAPLHPIQGIKTFFQDKQPETSPMAEVPVHVVMESGPKTYVEHNLGLTDNSLES